MLKCLWDCRWIPRQKNHGYPQVTIRMKVTRIKRMRTGSPIYRFLGNTWKTYKQSYLSNQREPSNSFKWRFCQHHRIELLFLTKTSLCKVLTFDVALVCIFICANKIWYKFIELMFFLCNVLCNTKTILIVDSLLYPNKCQSTLWKFIINIFKFY